LYRTKNDAVVPSAIRLLQFAGYKYKKSIGRKRVLKLEHSKKKLLGMYEKMCLIRKYEESIYYLFLEGIMPGSIHQSTGQEACAVGMLYDLRTDDYVASTHRPAGQCLAKGVTLKSMMCEMFGKEEGCCHGKGGAMHTGDIDVGVIPANAIVGGDLPIAAGIALSCKMRKTDQVVVCFMGDGATNEGSFHESLNAAAVWNLPQKWKTPRQGALARMAWKAKW